MKNDKAYYIITVLIIFFFVAYNVFIAISSLEGSPKERTVIGFFHTLTKNL